MAYFLDDELNALTTNAKAAPARTASSKGSQSRRTPNRYGKRCHKCSTWVQPQAGYLAKENGAWVVYCPTCP